jgi:hypothetical protein
VVPYVRWRIGVDYTIMHAYFLSYHDLSQALRTNFGTQWQIVLPNAAAYGVTGAAADVAEKINRVRVWRSLAARIAPSHISLARQA